MAMANPLQSIKAVGDSFTQGLSTGLSTLSTTLSSGIDNLAKGLPGPPGLPGGQAAGGGLKLPGIQALMPANLVQAVGNIENVIIPQGLPKISTLVKGAQPPETTPAAPAAPSSVGVITQGSPSSPSIIQQPDGSKPANTAIQGRRRITQLGGY